MSAPAQDLKDGCFRLLAVMVHRYSRDPATRALSSRQAMEAAILLHAAETLAVLAQQARKERAAERLTAPASGERA